MADDIQEIAVASQQLNLDQQRGMLDRVPWKSGATILDIGCGPGLHCAYFAEKGMKPTGLDREPHRFQHHGEFEHVAEMAQLEGRTFDYVFASHVLEHCPDTFSTLKQWRECLRPGGGLVLFVPPYSRFVSYDHWAVGWNVGQLAMWLVAAGFECSEATFIQEGLQCFGFGFKAEFESAGFAIHRAADHLPALFARAIVRDGHSVAVRGDIAHLSGSDLEFLASPALEQVTIPDKGLHLLAAGDAWRDAIMGLAAPMTDAKCILVARNTGTQTTAQRLSLGSGSQETPFSAEGDLWVELPPGLTIRQFEASQLTRRGDFRPAHAHTVAFGGPAFSHPIEFGLYDADGCSLLGAGSHLVGSVGRAVDVRLSPSRRS